MTILLLFILPVLSCLAAAPTEADANPEAYWNRGWNCGQAAEQFNVTIAVDDIDAAFVKVDAAMRAAGGQGQERPGGYFTGHYGNGAVRGRQTQYHFPLKAGEKAAKRVWDFGEMTNYSVARKKPDETIKNIDERIRLLEGELSVAESLGPKMPAARHFLKSKVSALRQARAVCEQGSSRSTVNVVFQGKPDRQER